MQQSARHKDLYSWQNTQLKKGGLKGLCQEIFVFLSSSYVSLYSVLSPAETKLLSKVELLKGTAHVTKKTCKYRNLSSYCVVWLLLGGTLKS